MIKIENVDVYGWKMAIKGMRNPLNSWDKSDTDFSCNEKDAVIGKADMSLMKKLVSSGSDHGKFMRMITVYMDITAPLYWWKEFDTYKVGTVANSCSTMHTIHKKPFTEDDFSMEHLAGKAKVMMTDYIIPQLNEDRTEYLESKNKDDWWQLIQLLPASFNQRRTIMLNYQVLKNIYNARKNHKLDEWHIFCDMIETLPCSELITNPCSELITNFQQNAKEIYYINHVDHLD